MKNVKLSENRFAHCARKINNDEETLLRKRSGQKRITIRLDSLEQTMPKVIEIYSRSTVKHIFQGSSIGSETNKKWKIIALRKELTKLLFAMQYCSADVSINRRI